MGVTQIMEVNPQSVVLAQQLVVEEVVTNTEVTEIQQVVVVLVVAVVTNIKAVAVV